MIKTKTVFVLGAGSSMPYGFPSGAELRDTLCNELSADTPLRVTLLQECGIGKSHCSNFGEALLRSSQPSIDSFLAKRADYAEVGKLAIAYELCRRESPLHLFRTDNDDHWYRALWAALERDAHNSALLGNNKVRFITFNYDRSLEFFLHESTKHTFNLSDEEALRAWQALPLLHVYGSLGDFHPSAAKNARPYADKVNEQDLRVAAAALRVVPDSRQDDKDFQTARNWFDWAERICFLGFGFDALNMERLALEDVLSWKKRNGAPTPWVVASMFGKTDREISAITGAHFSHADSHKTEKERNLMTLRHSGVLD